MRIKNHVPVVVTQEDVDEYGSVESAVNGRVVEAEKVCNELNRLRLIEFNAIGFDLIEFNSISFPVAAVKVLGQLQVGWWPCCSDADEYCPSQRDNLARHIRATDVIAIQLANQVAEKLLGMSCD